MDIIFRATPEAAECWQAMASFLSPMHFDHHAALYLLAAVAYWKHSWLPFVYLGFALVIQAAG